MIFSRACEYGIRAMLYLASQPNRQPMLIRDIAAEIHLPFPFLAKVVQILARHGLVSSQKGRGGGVSLCRAAEAITLLEVVEAIDGLDLTKRCVLGLPACSDAAPCPLHGQWAGIREGIVRMLGEQSLAKFVAHLKREEA